MARGGHQPGEGANGSGDGIGCRLVATQPGGFTSGALAVRVQERMGVSVQDYQRSQPAYDWKKLRGKNLLCQIGKGRQPVLRMRTLQGPPPRSNNLVDHQYYNLRQEVRRLFRTLKVA